MRPQENTRMTPEEYLEFEKTSEFRHEYFDGEIFAMTGAKRNHNLIGFNIAGELRGQIKGTPCRGFLSDQRVKIQGIDKYVYPDLTFACGDIEFLEYELDSLVNPVVIVEILSDSTELYDRVLKFEHYQLIDSLQEYILVSQHRPRVEKYERNREDNTWILSSYTKMDHVIKINSINCELLLSDVYFEIEFTTDG